MHHSPTIENELIKKYGGFKDGILFEMRFSGTRRFKFLPGMRSKRKRCSRDTATTSAASATATAYIPGTAAAAVSATAAAAVPATAAAAVPATFIPTTAAKPGKGHRG